MKPISVLEYTNNINIVVRIAVKHKDRFLVVQEGKPECYGKWSFVGGKLDMNENLSVAAIREVKEETGVDIDLVGILGLRFGHWDDKAGLILEIFFLGSTEHIPASYKSSKEIIAVDWKTLDELEKLREEGQLRNKSQGAIIKFLIKGESLPIENLFEKGSSGFKNV